MAIFRRKGGDDGGESPSPYTPQPEKARKWFDHARTAAMSSNHEYALHCFASGLRFDPESMTVHEEMYQAAVQFAARGGKPAASKEIRKIDDGTPVGRFAGAEFAWMRDINNAALALKAIEAAAKAGQHEWGHWAAGPALALLRRARKPSKGQLLQAKDLFAEVSAWNEAITAGELALSLDPADSKLAADLKDLAAQRAISQGGYTETGGQEGGFRKFVKDIDAQRELEEAESLSGSGGSEERNLVRAKEAYEAAPTATENITRYVQLLKRRATDDAFDEAERICLAAYEATGEYRFRAAAGDIRLDRRRAAVREIVERIRANGDSAELRSRLDRARGELLELESAEYRERVTKYPTDRPLRFHLGRVELELGNLDQAMESFQKAKDEPKLRVRAGHLLGRCFAREGWHSDAIAEFRDALGAIDATEEERELEVRYDLMNSLAAHARAEGSLELAKEARDICSSIARRDISFKDIRDKRNEVDELVKELSGG